MEKISAAQWAKNRRTTMAAPLATMRIGHKKRKSPVMESQGFVSGR
jgi:hypothetical protein